MENLYNMQATADELVRLREQARELEAETVAPAVQAPAVQAPAVQITAPPVQAERAEPQPVGGAGLAQAPEEGVANK